MAKKKAPEKASYHAKKFDLNDPNGAKAYEKLVQKSINGDGILITYIERKSMISKDNKFLVFAFVEWRDLTKAEMNAWGMQDVVSAEEAKKEALAKMEMDPTRKARMEAEANTWPDFPSKGVKIEMDSI